MLVTRFCPIIKFYNPYGKMLPTGKVETPVGPKDRSFFRSDLLTLHGAVSEPNCASYLQE